MAFLFGVSMVSPEDAMGRLAKTSAVDSITDIGVVASGYRLQAEPPSPVLFFLSIRDFQRNLLVLNSKKYEQVVCLLFGSPLALVATNAELIDADRETLEILPKPNFGKIVKVIRKSSPPKLRVDKIDFISRFVDDARTGSLLNPLMTFIYSLKSQQQGYVKLMCAKWLSRNASIDTLRAKLQNYEYPISANKFGQLSSILLSEEAASFRRAFQELRAGARVSDVCAKHSVPEYEVNYLSSVLTSTGSKNAKLPRKT